jgi:hypothetical protein
VPAFCGIWYLGERWQEGDRMTRVLDRERVHNSMHRMDKVFYQGSQLTPEGDVKEPRKNRNGHKMKSWRHVGENPVE